MNYLSTLSWYTYYTPAVQWNGLGHSFALFVFEHRGQLGKAIGYKSLTKELAWYIESGKKSQNLEKLYQALLTISPTSVAVERMFSTSGWLLNQRRASMSDSTLDDIIFLKSYFERQKK